MKIGRYSIVSNPSKEYFEGKAQVKSIEGDEVECMVAVGFDHPLDGNIRPTKIYYQLIKVPISKLINDKV